MSMTFFIRPVKVEVPLPAPVIKPPKKRIAKEDKNGQLRDD